MRKEKLPYLYLWLRNATANFFIKQLMQLSIVFIIDFQKYYIETF